MKLTGEIDNKIKYTAIIFEFIKFCIAIFIEINS